MEAERIEKEIGRPTYSRRQRAAWMLLEMPPFIGYLFMAVFLVANVFFWPGWWKILPGIIALPQIISFPFEVIGYIARYQVRRDHDSELAEIFEHAGRDDDDNRPLRRFAGGQAPTGGELVTEVIRAED